MGIKRPTPSQLGAVAHDLGMTLTDDDLRSYLELMAASFGAYDAVEAMPDYLPEVKYPRNAELPAGRRREPRTTPLGDGRGPPASLPAPAGDRAAGVPGTVGGDDAAARNEPAHLPWRVGSPRPLALPSSRLWTARARAHGLDGAAGRRSGWHRGEDRQSACLELGGPDAPGVRHRRVGVCPLWRPPTADRHAARGPGPGRGGRRRRVLVLAILHVPR